MIYLKVIFGIVSVACIAFAVFNIWDFMDFCKNAFSIIYKWLKGFTK